MSPDENIVLFNYFRCLKCLVLHFFAINKMSRCPLPTDWTQIRHLFTVQIFIKRKNNFELVLRTLWKCPLLRQRRSCQGSSAIRRWGENVHMKQIKVLETTIIVTQNYVPIFEHEHQISELFKKQFNKNSTIIIVNFSDSEKLSY